MGRRQKVALAVGLVVMALMALYPPWNYSTWGVGKRAPLPPGYASIPEVEVVRCTYAPVFRPPTWWKTRLNWKRLIGQEAVVLVVVGYCVFRVRE